MIALDASVVLAALFAERGYERVGTRLAGALLSALNLAEVLSKIAESGGRIDETRIGLRRAGVEVVPFGEAQASRTAALREPTRSRGLSLADRACLALALERGVPALTADRAWAGLEIGVEIRLIR